MKSVQLFGTKEIIFDTAVRFFSESGYESINMREIADASGIRAASIYNHFASKQEILDTIYQYYREHFEENLLYIKDIKEIIATGTREQIINAMAFTFENADEKIYTRMVLITKIIYLRVIKDKTADDIFRNLMSSIPEAYIQSYLEYGISIKRFKPFDVKTFSSLLNNSRHMVGIKAFADPDYSVRQLEVEKEILKMISQLLPLAD